MARKKKKYSRRLICFDIETTSTTDEKTGQDMLVTWHWQAMVQNSKLPDIFYYTWNSWKECLSGLLDLCKGEPTICFVHNLSFRNRGDYSKPWGSCDI